MKEVNKVSIDKVKAELDSFQKLTGELCALDPTYQFDIEKRQIIRTKGKLECRIFRAAIYGRGELRVYSYAMRINTNDCEINNNTLNKDLGAKGLAESLHKACNKLFEKYEEQANRKTKEEQKDARIKNLVKQSFGENVKVEKRYVGQYRGGGYYNGYDVEFSWGKLRTYDGKVFNIVSTKKSLDVEQVKALGKFLKTL